MKMDVEATYQTTSKIVVKVSQSLGILTRFEGIQYTKRVLFTHFDVVTATSPPPRPGSYGTQFY